LRSPFSSDSSSSENTVIKPNDESQNESDEPEKYAMPDRDMELKLAQIQSTISEHYQHGDFSKALKVSQQLYQQSQAHFGQEHPATASSLNNMGLMQKLLGDFLEARKHYNAALRIYAKVVGRDHASYAMTLHNLASLNKAQVHFDTSLKATDRLTLVETALEYFEEAWIIRKAELGEDHPLTLATQSSMGTTLAAQVLHQHRHVEGNTSTKYVSLNPESVTRKGWEAAESHLRHAMVTSIAKPRGKSIHGKKIGKSKQAKGTRISPPSAATKKAADDEKQAIDTLSAASAAQNLAVFLKSRAMTEDPYNDDMMQEAHTLYERVIKVRSQLLPNLQHPDLLASKYSLAELLEVKGDQDAANVIRQEILDDYEPSSEEDDLSAATQQLVGELPTRKVLVQQTKGAAKTSSTPS
jgi:tetratricopeptide (TPR) repeat protein